MSAINDAMPTPIPGRFRAGNEGYRMRVERRASIRAGLIADYDFSAPSAALLLPVIVEQLHASSRARTNVDRTRAANVARRLLKDIPRRKATTSAPARRLSELGVK